MLVPEVNASGVTDEDKECPCCKLPIYSREKLLGHLMYCGGKDKYRCPCCLKVANSIDDARDIYTKHRVCIWKHMHI